MYANLAIFLFSPKVNGKHAAFIAVVTCMHCLSIKSLSCCPADSATCTLHIHHLALTEGVEWVGAGAVSV